MKKILLTLTVLGGLALATQAQESSQFGAIDSFYQANTDFSTYQYAGRSVNPAYWLVDWDRWPEMNDRLTSNGFVRLGVSSWEENGGVPEKATAIAYAHSIGADVVIYATRSETDSRTDYQPGYRTSHYIGFFAKPSVQQATPVRVNRAPASGSRPSDAAVSAAVDRWTDAHNSPRVKGGVHYDASTDTYRWIGPTKGKPMSKPAKQLLSELSAYL